MTSPVSAVLTVSLAALLAAVACRGDPEAALSFNREGPRSIQKGNDAFETEQYSAALEAYNRALDSMSDSPNPSTPRRTHCTNWTDLKRR